jgi:hypothetical protein
MTLDAFGKVVVWQLFFRNVPVRSMKILIVPVVVVTYKQTKM